jgi:hypothetical protein
VTASLLAAPGVGARAWLTTGVSAVAKKHIRASKNHDFITATVSIAAAERLLHTHYHLYKREDGHQTAVRCEHYALPHDVSSHARRIAQYRSSHRAARAQVEAHVDFVGGTIRFPVIQRRRTGPAVKLVRARAPVRLSLHY